MPKRESPSAATDNEVDALAKRWKPTEKDEDDVPVAPITSLHREESMRQMSEALVFAAAPVTDNADLVFLDAKRREHAIRLREAYEDAFNSNEDPVGFLVEVGKQLKAGLSARWQQDVPLSDHPPLEIVFEGKTRSFVGNQPIIIGRAAPPSGIRLPDGQGSSRVHAVLFPFPGSNKLVVADVGSFSGIATRSHRPWSGDCVGEEVSSHDLVDSTSTHRRTLVFDLRDCARLGLGSQEVTLNPPHCPVCYDKTPDVRLGCGHNLCKACADTIQSTTNTCPTCRADISSVRSSFDYVTEYEGRT